MRLELIPQIDENGKDPMRPWRGFFRVIETESSECIHSVDCTEEIGGATSRDQARSFVEARITDYKSIEDEMRRLVIGILVEALRSRRVPCTSVAEAIAGKTWLNSHLINDLIAIDHEGWDSVADPAVVRNALQSMKSLLA